MSRTKPTVEVQKENNAVVVNSRFDDFETAEGESLREAIDRHDHITVEEERDVVVEDTDGNFGLGSNLETAMVQYIMDVDDVSRKEAICKVLKPKIRGIHRNEVGIEVEFDNTHRAHAQNDEEAIVNYYEEELF